ncbi:MAG: translesion error-prone DNA polymerase V autoproteolytic subunit [Candidatus Cloacimonadales bacterium]|jgi:DNA polymerase V|nr:translesion error-prone DNA polymerase V autoproteolytic subunit [Candidatus Cloacimonadota bacterium]MDY0380593.1 translesion error-prone DNA polymerase V autoproteolytic subunit [Candidatus Cloacimonadaceae bacterium]HCX59865.1 peptidase S24 [Candidatus Cloacimonas sp.]MCB5256972.1 translesion error-prone DNA polymerase V autoproteolytic subunit [Candidatus Cloacimonadota bacterium]MCB5263920.1 translesion error-prone DNA polymerase V autoproteolytic subunit [Candidatus Cloacimonadota bact
MNKLKTDGSIKAVYKYSEGKKISRPIVGAIVPAGFPSPAQDYIEGMLDISEHLIRHPSSTFFMYADGYSMIGAGIQPGDLLIVDRAIEAKSNKIIIAIVDNELTLKRLRIEDGQYWLVPENEEFEPIRIHEEMDFIVWGVVTFVIHQL